MINFVKYHIKINKKLNLLKDSALNHKIEFGIIFYI